MGKKLRLQHSHSIDFAPGVSNVALRKDGVEYYCVETFHSSSFYDAITPVLATDLIHSVNIVDVYGYHAMRALKENVTLLNNHPVRRVKLTGRISEYSIKEIKGESWYFISLDDSSGVNIQCMVSSSVLMGCGLRHEQSEGCLVEVSGYCKRSYGSVEVKVDGMRHIKDPELKHEIQFWNEALRVRAILKTPWYQTPQRDDGTEISFITDHSAQRRRLMENNIYLGEQLAGPALVLDSSIYVMKMSLKKAARDARGENQDISSDSDIEEVTQDVFQTTAALRMKKLQSSIDNVWISPHKLRISRGHDLLELTVKLMMWMYTNKERRFHLNKPYQDGSIRQYLKRWSREQFSLQVVDLTNGEPVKSVNEIHGELFHKARHLLQRSGLIVCTKNKQCTAAMLIDFMAELVASLQQVKLNGGVLADFVYGFNVENRCDIELEQQLFDRLVHTLVYLDGGTQWKFNTTSHQWAYRRC